MYTYTYIYIYTHVSLHQYIYTCMYYVECSRLWPLTWGVPWGPGGPSLGSFAWALEALFPWALGSVHGICGTQQ